MRQRRPVYRALWVQATTTGLEQMIVSEREFHAVLHFSGSSWETA